MTDDPGETAPLLQALRERLAVEALHIVLPLSVAAYDAVVSSSGAPRAGEMLAAAAGVILIGDGGPGFFARFRDAAPYASGVDHPLDDFTRGCVTAAVTDVLAPLGLPFKVMFPFDSAGPPLPFQRLGRAAGLPEPGPLWLQIHPEFGPWWAYRGLVLVPSPLEAEAPLLPWCPACDQPCVRGCAVHQQGQEGDWQGASIDRLCSDDCGARLRCPVGPEHAYPTDQRAFHARAREELRALDRVAGRS